MNRRTLRSKNMDVRKHRRLCYHTLTAIREESEVCNYENRNRAAIPVILNILRKIR